jgi:hypothetical protein
MLPLSGETDGSVWVLKSDYDDQLGPDTIKEICAACFAWLDSSNAENVTSATLTKVVADTNFKKIIDIHLRVKESGNPTLFPDYLIALTKCTSQTPFLIVYTFITGETHGCFSRCRVGSLPAPKLAKVMREKGLGLDLVPEVQHEQLPWLPVANQSFEKIGTSARETANSQIRTITTLKSSAPQPIDSESSEFSLGETHMFQVSTFSFLNDYLFRCIRARSSRNVGASSC